MCIIFMVVCIFFYWTKLIKHFQDPFPQTRLPKVILYICELIQMPKLQRYLCNYQLCQRSSCIQIRETYTNVFMPKHEKRYVQKIL